MRPIEDMCLDADMSERARQVLALRTILYAGKRVLFVVPYVSIVVEKVRFLRRYTRMRAQGQHLAITDSRRGTVVGRVCVS